MVKVVTKRKRGRPQTKYKKVVVAAGGGTQVKAEKVGRVIVLSLIHISEPTRPY